MRKDDKFFVETDGRPFGRHEPYILEKPKYVKLKTNMQGRSEWLSPDTVYRVTEAIIVNTSKGDQETYVIDGFPGMSFGYSLFEHLDLTDEEIALWQTLQ
jgi:hypothetical protein